MLSLSNCLPLLPLKHFVYPMPEAVDLDLVQACLSVEILVHRLHSINFCLCCFEPVSQSVSVTAEKDQRSRSKGVCQKLYTVSSGTAVSA